MDTFYMKSLLDIDITWDGSGCMFTKYIKLSQPRAYNMDYYYVCSNCKKTKNWISEEFPTCIRHANGMSAKQRAIDFGFMSCPFHGQSVE